jgi:hypothetical protein
VRVARAASTVLRLALAFSLAFSLAVSLMPAGIARAAVNRAPSVPPLDTGLPRGAGEETAGVPSAGGDQLVENGLSSPLCQGVAGAGLSAEALSNCHTSGFVGAPAPTNNYAIDVHIDTGAFGLSKGGLLSVIQDVFVAPVWNGLLWLVHALVVMLEWCYTLELLGGSSMSRVALALRQAQASFTEPWLTLVLALASMLAFYNGLIRRRIAETLGQALTTLAMMACGLWIIANPLGTVGVVGQWANQASLGTLGAVAEGTPSDAPRTLGDSMRALFAGTIEMPWCYLEFGNVRWCSDPALLDRRLRTAAVRLAADEQAKFGCLSSARLSCSQSAAGSTAVLGAEHSRELVAQANTNGKLFLAFPANESQRNSVKEASSLLHILCQAENDTKCSGATAAEAEFRSDGGTFARMIGVVLIAAGVLGMALLFGLIAVRLLVAAVIGLFLLLLAPFAVLAPALGDGGRALFVGWATQLFGAVVSKLIFSFLLGALLSMQRILMSLEPLGWWTQWLLISAFWWVVFLKRHRAAAFLRSGGRPQIASESRPLGRRIEGVRTAHRAVRRPVSWTKSKILGQASVGEQLQKRVPAPAGALGQAADLAVPDAVQHRQAAANSRGSARERWAPRRSARRARLGLMMVDPEAALLDGDEVGAMGAGGARPNERGQWAPGSREWGSTLGDDDRAPASADETAQPTLSVHGPVPEPMAGVSEPRMSVRHTSGRPPEMRSSIMDDARAVAEGRKRQLGFDRPPEPGQPPERALPINDRLPPERERPPKQEITPKREGTAGRDTPAERERPPKPETPPEREAPERPIR